MQLIVADPRAALPDMDVSPTKTWLIAHRDDARRKRHYDLAFAARPAAEIYDACSDSVQVNDLAGNSTFALQKNAWAEQGGEEQ